MAQSRYVLTSPAPDALLVGFDASSMNYRARFWVDDFERDEEARDDVRVAIHYVFARRGIEIPYPIQVEYSRDWPAPDAAALAAERRRVIDGVDLFAALSDEQRGEVASATVSEDLWKRRSDRQAGRAWRIDVRAVLRNRGGGARAGQERGRDDSSGRLLRRDVAADRRAKVSDGRGPGRSGRSRVDRGGVPAPRRGQPARHRAGGSSRRLRGGPSSTARGLPRGIWPSPRPPRHSSRG